MRKRVSLQLKEAGAWDAIRSIPGRVRDSMSVTPEGEQVMRTQTMKTTLNNAIRSLSELSEFEELAGQIQPIVQQLNGMLQTVSQP